MVLRTKRQDLKEPEFLVSSQVLSSAPSKIPAVFKKEKEKDKSIKKNQVSPERTLLKLPLF